MKKEEVVTTCDFDEIPAVAQNMHFIYDGNLYEIDLCQMHLTHYLHMLDTFRTHGRKIGKAKDPNSKPVRNRNKARREHDARVREWAKDHGHNVADRGRIPNKIQTAYANRRQS